MPDKSQDILSEKEQQGWKIAEGFEACKKAVATQRLRDDVLHGIISEWCNVPLDEFPSRLVSDDFPQYIEHVVHPLNFEWFDIEELRQEILFYMEKGWSKRLETEDPDRAKGMEIRKSQLLDLGLKDGSALVLAQETAHG